ncbi:MAG TPA: hypothetical protein V6D15_13750 [Oculatellaceae cyanobacterium]
MLRNAIRYVLSQSNLNMLGFPGQPNLLQKRSLNLSAIALCL